MKHRRAGSPLRITRILKVASMEIIALCTGTIAVVAQLPADLANRTATIAQHTDEDGVTPLMRAVRDGETRSARSLIKETGDVDAQDVYGWSALTYAARRGDVAMVVALANKGADLNHQSDDGLTPLMYAAGEGYPDVVRVLLERGAIFNATSTSGATALSLAQLRNNSSQSQAGHDARTISLSQDRERRDYAEVVEQLKKAGAIEGRPGPLLLISPPIDSRPVPLNHPYPSYTEEARKHKINARIDMRVLVGEDGVVKKVRTLTGAPYGLTDQAVTAASQLRFKPASRGGKPAEFWTSLSMDFNLR